jgi:hypothetical protein
VKTEILTLLSFEENVKKLELQKTKKMAFHFDDNLIKENALKFENIMLNLLKTEFKSNCF